MAGCASVLISLYLNLCNANALQKRNWYPDYMNPWTPPQTPVWKTTFKSYDAVPSMPKTTNGTNPLATSGSTGQLLSSDTPQLANVPIQSLPRNSESARVLVNGLCSGSTSRSPLAQAQAPAVNYQKASTAVPAYTSSSMPHRVGYNMGLGPTPQSTKGNLIRGPSSVRSSTSPRTREPSIVEPPPWDGCSEFIDGSTYFKIGEYVFIRRWHATKKVYSPWLRGQVVRPDFRKAPDGQKEERIYMVSYWDSGVQKERTYSPLLKEIREMPDNLGRSTIAVTAASTNTDMQTSKTTVDRNSTVFALLQVTNVTKPHSIWTPSVCLAIENPQGYRVRAISGPLKNQEFSKVLKVKPYNAETAKYLRDSGYRVEESGVDCEH